MENPWLEFVKNLDDNNLVLEQEKEIIEKFNNSTNETYKVHTEIMPAPFMGNVLTSPIVLLTLNPGYDEKEEEKNYIRKERYYGEYSRSFALGDVDVDNIDAKFENGILNITVPKKEIQENKKYIEVK